MLLQNVHYACSCFHDRSFAKISDQSSWGRTCMPARPACCVCVWFTSSSPCPDYTTSLGFHNCKVIGGRILPLYCLPFKAKALEREDIYNFFLSYLCAALGSSEEEGTLNAVCLRCFIASPQPSLETGAFSRCKAEYKVHSFCNPLKKNQHVKYCWVHVCVCAHTYTYTHTYTALRQFITGQES